VTPEGDGRVESLCLEALARRVDERVAFLDEACAGDPELRRRVEVLLARAGGFLETPAWEAAPPLKVGARLGAYEIEGEIGSGGMGEVYRARDTRLERTVAIKVLPRAFGGDPERRARFEREAKTIAGLNHPHICTLHDIGDHEGTVFLVMELLAGETLAEHLRKGPLPLEQALTVATHIAEALAAAHRQGIIHRDLKPANVMLTKAGAKLLDFGLAKLKRHGAQPEGADAPSAPTLSAALTGERTIVGTLQYMAPEQLEGRPVDARTDIFAFGAVLHEMLTGRKAFDGQSHASLMSAILTAHPPAISSVEPASPPALDHVVQRCLAKDPEDRWQNAGDLVIELKWIAAAGAEPAAAVRSRKAARVLQAAVAVLALALVASLAVNWMSRRMSPAPPRPVQFTVVPPAPYVLSTLDVPALSPDGTKLAFTARPPDGPSALFERELDSLEVREIAGTSGASSPFWSPDGERLGFFSNRKLKTVTLSGASPATLADGYCCGTWGRDGVILFTGSGPSVRDRRTFRISSEGGLAAEVGHLDASRSERLHQWPVLLPDGRHFLYFSRSGRPDVQGIYEASLSSGETKRVMSAASHVVFVPPGYLLFRLQGRLMVQAYDWRQSRVTGEPIQVAEMVAGADQTAYNAATFAAAPDALAYIPGTATPSTLTWLDRRGTRLGSVGDPGEYYSPQLSPDERTLAVGRYDLATDSRDIWLFDLTRGGAPSRFTFDPADDMNPAWSPDGTRIAFTSARSGQRDIYEKTVGGPGEERLLLSSGTDKHVEYASPDGRMLLFNVIPESGRQEIWALPLVSGGKPFALLRGPADTQSSPLSPDGKFIAYHSSESGRYEIFIQALASGRRWPISIGGGMTPQWRPDGRELFYIAGSRLMAVDITMAGGRVEAGVPHALFEAPFWRGGRNVFVPSRDGRRFLAILQPEQTASRSITVELNWMSRLKQ